MAGMNKILLFLSKHNTMPIYFSTFLLRLCVTPYLFSLSSPEFFPVAVCNVIIMFLDLLLILFCHKLSKITSLTFYVLILTFFCIFEAKVTNIVCGMELCLFACLSGIFLFTTEEKTPPHYHKIMNSILCLSIAYLLWLKLSNLPPQQLFLPERRTFLILSEVIYTSAVLTFLLYSCLITDITLRRLHRKREFLQKELNYIAKHDPLTGLMNRRRTLEIFNSVKETKLKDNIEYAVAIFDIDNFKKINDTYGHDAGDFILKSFTKLIWDEFKDPVKIGRWGGEEFIIIFPEVTEDTIYILEQVRLKVTRAPVIYGDLSIPVTATFGICSSRNFSTPEDVLNEADRVLLIGKQNGKNRIVVSDKF